MLHLVKNDDQFNELNVKKARISINWKKHSENINADKIISKMSFIPPENFELAESQWMVNIGDYPVPLNMVKIRSNGKIVEFYNVPKSKNALQIKGKAVKNNKGKVRLVIKVKNADLVRNYGMKNKNVSLGVRNLPITLTIGNSKGHVTVPLTETTKMNLKSVLNRKK